MKIPLSRLLIYLVLAGALPLLAVGFFHTKEKHQWEEVAAHIKTVTLQGNVKTSRQSLNSLVREKFEQADRHYVERLEALTFLEQEKSALEALFSSRCFTGNEIAQARYNFLTGNDNRLFFAEKEMEKGDGIRETLEVSTHPIEIDHTDLQTILSLIEKEQLGKPQLIITDFYLRKKPKPSGNEIFELSLAFIKREFEK
ncbi:MAG: hypothetical protein S4CHLAM45_10870 [Chlamydiales bacterium]|nr:hypothetical protein [Chlamydiales bacterium]MCH9619579.1 hypothetical protein [Chlamydiales bacterium]MCH9623185.1 hypothetical protein [Chlamydiales bacterium]